MKLDAILNAYSLIHYQQQKGLQGASEEERLVVTTDSSGQKSLDIRTLSLGERLLAAMGIGPASEDSLLEYINTALPTSPEKELLEEKVHYIFDDQLDRPSAIIALSSVSNSHDRTLLKQILEQPEVRDNVNAKVAGDDTALMQAIRKNNKDAFFALVDVTGINLDVWNHQEECTALILAIKLDRRDFVQELLKRGCKIPVKAYLEAKNHPHMLTALKSATQAQKSGLLVDAVDKKNEAALKKIINDFHDIDMIPAFEHAVHSGNLEMVDKLVGHHVDRFKALQVAIRDWAMGGISLTSRLFQKLLKENIGNMQAAMSYLGELRPVECVRTKDEYLALFDILKVQDDKVLIKAEEKGNWPLVQALLESGVPVQRAVASKMLLKAASRAGPEVVSLLLAKGADTTFTDSRGHTALDRAKFRLTLAHIPGGSEQAEAVLDLLQEKTG